MNQLIAFLWLIFVIYLTFNAFYLLISAIAGRFGHFSDEYKIGTTPHLRRIAVLIPAYKEDAVISSSVRVNMQQTYPVDLYDLVVIADSLQPETLSTLSELPVILLPVSFEQSTVQRSIQYALSHLPDAAYDIVLVSDADNHMAPDFLMRINQAFGKGWRAVQGHRVAKNINTSVAIFDAMNEEVNNTIFRAGQRVLGFSASLIGSGMAFESTLMKQALDQIQTVGGYDKELEMLLAVAGIRIGYLPSALIYDEKVQDVAFFKQQRTRWIAAQIYFVKAYFRLGIDQLFKGNLLAFNMMIKSLLLPRMIMLGLLGLLVPISFFLNNGYWTWYVSGLMGSLVISLGIAIPPILWHKVSLRDFLVLPLLIFSMFRSLLSYKQAKKKFLHTPHTDISNLL